MKHFNRNLRAISPVLAILMMIAVAIAGSLVVYAWVRGYIDLSTEKSGQAINVHSIANHENDLVVYVQNTGEGVTQLDEAGCLYVNGQMVECKILGVTVSDGVATLAEGETATITYAGGAAPSGEKVEIKVTTQLGAFAEYSDYPAGNPYASILDHFIFDTIESPQTVGVPFSVTIRAIDQYGTRLTTYSGPNMFYSTGNMTAQEGGSWILGIFTFNVTFTDSTTNVTIGTASLSEPSKNGTSNTFNVVDSPVVYSLDSTQILFAGGARWTSPEGKSALYINVKDNWEAHHLTDGADWGPWYPEEHMNSIRTRITAALEYAGFEVTYAADVPEDLSMYDLVVFEAEWAVEPQHVPLVRDYLANGGGVVVYGATPPFFSVYCKDCWPYRLGGTNLSPLHDWFGASNYGNTDGNATLTVDKPFDTELEIGELVSSGTGSGAAVTNLDDDAQVIAMWKSGWVFAFTHEYGNGRVYYQASMELFWD